MAAWQIEFYVVPRRAVASQGPVIASNLPTTGWWTTDTLPADYRDRLSAAAAVARSPSAEIETWGSEDGNRIDVRSKDGRATAVMVRVDARKLDSKFGAALLQFVRTADAVLIRSDGLVVEPKIANYAAALRSSAAWKASGDPSAFLRRVSDPDADDS